MVSVDLVYKTVQTIINKDQNGYVSPTEFNLIANKVQEDIFRGYFEDHNKDKQKENRGVSTRGYSHLSLYERQRINQFSKTLPITKSVPQMYFALPQDLYFIEDNGIIASNSGFSDSEGNSSTSTPVVVIEEVEKHVIGFLNRSMSAPTKLYPVYERFPDFIRVYPASINYITLRYIRKPNAPKWTYTVVAGKELFDPSNPDFNDFDLHESEFTTIVARALLEFGINLREQEIVEIADKIKTEINIQKDN